MVITIEMEKGYAFYVEKDTDDIIGIKNFIENQMSGDIFFIQDSFTKKVEIVKTKDIHRISLNLK